MLGEMNSGAHLRGEAGFKTCDPQASSGKAMDATARSLKVEFLQHSRLRELIWHPIWVVEIRADVLGAVCPRGAYTSPHPRLQVKGSLLAVLLPTVNRSARGCQCEYVWGAPPCDHPRL